MTRRWLRDTTTNERDVSAEYEDVSAGVTATMYVYKTQLPDASLWFDRSLETIRLLPMWKLGDRPRPAMQSFTLPGSMVASGLIGGFDVDASGVSGTALAVAPLDGWMVKVRLSSSRLDGAASVQRLREFMAALRWPSSVGVAAPAARIEDCPSRLAFKRAKIIKPDMSQSLISGLFGAMSARAKPQAVDYCREPGSTLSFGVYRPKASLDSYVLTMAMRASLCRSRRL